MEGPTKTGLLSLRARARNWVRSRR